MKSSIPMFIVSVAEDTVVTDVKVFWLVSEVIDYVKMNFDIDVEDFSDSVEVLYSSETGVNLNAFKHGRHIRVDSI